MKLSDRLRFESREARELDICIDASTFNQWADEVAALETELIKIEEEKQHWWVLACQRFAELTKAKAHAPSCFAVGGIDVGQERHCTCGAEGR